MIEFYQRRPRIAWAITGAVVGMIIGLTVIGNFGVASRGQGYAVWGWLLGAGLGAYIGFRIGEWRRNVALKSSSKTD